MSDNDEELFGRLLDGEPIKASVRLNPPDVEIREEDRQLFICSLALTALLRPGWDYACGTLAEKLRGREEFEGFKRRNAHSIAPQRTGPDPDPYLDCPRCNVDGSGIMLHAKDMFVDAVSRLVLCEKHKGPASKKILRIEVEE
jgi:hypothetical protein